jgi:DNA anti-recombination protein RmuC
MRQTLEKKIGDMQQGNEQKLEQMRITVDEKLQQTLEARLWYALLKFNGSAICSIKCLVRFRCSLHAESHPGFTFPFRLYHTGTTPA